MTMGFPWREVSNMGISSFTHHSYLEAGPVMSSRLPVYGVLPLIGSYHMGTRLVLGILGTYVTCNPYIDFRSRCVGPILQVSKLKVKEDK